MGLGNLAQVSVFFKVRLGKVGFWSSKRVINKNRKESVFEGFYTVLNIATNSNASNIGEAGSQLEISHRGEY